MELTTADTKEKIKISEIIFKCNFNEQLIHQVIVAYQAHQRQGTAAQKTRSEVSGSKKKPWKQKGTGRARSGSVKSPIWRSGGVTFAKKPKNYNQKINKKMYRLAVKSILSELIRQNRLIIVKKIILQTPKTKELIETLKKMFLEKVLIITDKIEKNLMLSSRNLYKVKVCNFKKINPVELINSEKTVIELNSIKKIEEILV